MENDDLAGTAPAEVATAVTSTDPVQTGETNSPDAEKVFSQEELDQAIGKRLAREQRKWDRQNQAAQAPVPAPSPPQENFESVDAYADRLATQRAEQILQQREAKRQQDEVLNAYHEQEEDARLKYDDFQQVAYNPDLKISTVMAQSIQAADNGAEIAYFLGANPREAERISRLTQIAQAKEIGKIEAKLTSDPPTKRSSSAPPPIEAGTARGGTSKSFDTSDPRSIKTMSTSQWIEAERMRQIKQWEQKSKYR